MAYQFEGIDFGSGDVPSGRGPSSHTYPVACSALRKNGYVMLKMHPCKIVEMSTSAPPGKHGCAKVHLVGNDIFTGMKYEESCPLNHNMDVPRVTRKDYMFLDIEDDDYVVLIDPCSGENRSHIKLPEGDLSKDIRKTLDSGEYLTVTVLEAVGQTQVVAVNTLTD